MEEPTPDRHSVERDIIYILISITFVAPLTPSLFRKYITGGGKWIPRLNCFAAGIFFGITFFHILPEAFSNTQRLFENSDDMTALKVTCGMFTVGFLLLLWIDRLWFSKYHDATDNHNHHTNIHSQHETHRTPRLEDSILAFDSDDGQLEISEGENNEDPFPTENKSKRAIAIGTLAAFSFHSFLEGVAIGSERPNLELLGLIIVFSFHKALDGLAVTIPLMKAGFKGRLYWTLIIGFSTMTPMGLVSAFSLMRPGGPLTRFSGLVESFSGGIFLYIALFHILREEIDGPSGREMVKILSGFTFALLVVFVLEMIV